MGDEWFPFSKRRFGFELVPVHKLTHSLSYLALFQIGYLREDNTFVVHGVPSGSYLVEVVNPDHFYEPIRVDINSKGKIRARKVNNVQPSQVSIRKKGGQ